MAHNKKSKQPNSKMILKLNMEKAYDSLLGLLDASTEKVRVLRSMEEYNMVDYI